MSLRRWLVLVDDTQHTIIRFFGTGREMVMVSEYVYSDGSIQRVTEKARYENYIKNFFERIRYDNRHLVGGEARYIHLIEREKTIVVKLSKPGSNWTGD